MTYSNPLRNIVAKRVSITWALFTVVMLGCSASSSLQRHEPVSFSSQVRVFGLLEQVGGDYRFTRFRSDAAGSGTWVDLQTGKPMWSAPSLRCGKGFIKDRNRQVPSCDDVVRDEQFMEGRALD